MNDKMPDRIHQNCGHKQNVKVLDPILDVTSANNVGYAERYAASAEPRDCERLQGEFDCELQGLAITEMCEPCARYFRAYDRAAMKLMTTTKRSAR